QHGLARPGTVVNACAEQAVLIRQPQTTVIDPGGADRGASDDLCPVFQMADPLAGDDLAANTRALDQDFRAEAACLLAGALGELSTADAFREPQVILNLWAGAGLPADRVALDQDGAESLGGTIDSGTEPGWPRTVDRQII